MAAVAVLLLVLAGCTGSPQDAGSGRATAGTAAGSTVGGTSTPSGPGSPSSSAPGGPACPEPTVPAAAPPTDFPHPTLTRYPVDPTTQAADEQLAAQGLAATRTFGGPIAATAFQHYLDASGQYLTLPVDDLLTATPAFVTALDATLVRAATPVVQQLLAAGTPACRQLTFASDWLVYDALTAGDWYATLGGFRYRVQGTASRAIATGATAADGAAADAQVRVTFRAAVGDTYDFDPGTPFAGFGDLARHGRAADFLDGGLTRAVTTTVTAGGSALATPGFG